MGPCLFWSASAMAPNSDSAASRSSTIFLGDHLRRQEIVAALQARVPEPGDVEVRLVARDHLVVGEHTEALGLHALGARRVGWRAPGSRACVAQRPERPEPRRAAGRRTAQCHAIARSSAPDAPWRRRVRRR